MNGLAEIDLSSMMNSSASFKDIDTYLAGPKIRESWTKRRWFRKNYVEKWNSSLSKLVVHQKIHVLCSKTTLDIIVSYFEFPDRLIPFLNTQKQNLNMTSRTLISLSLSIMKNIIIIHYAVFFHYYRKQ